MLTKRRISVVVIVIVIVAVSVPVVSAATPAPYQLPDLPPISPELLASIYAGILSLLLTYVPGLNEKWAGLPEDQKKTIMGLGLIVISVGVFAASCAPVLGIALVECSAGGALKLVSILFAALMANQTLHRIAPEPSAVKRAKAARQ